MAIQIVTKRVPNSRLLITFPKPRRRAVLANLPAPETPTFSSDNSNPPWLSVHPMLVPAAWRPSTCIRIV